VTPIFERIESINGPRPPFRVDKIIMRHETGQEMGYIQASFIPSEINFNMFHLLDLKGVRFYSDNGEQIFNKDQLSHIGDDNKIHSIIYTAATHSKTYDWTACNKFADAAIEYHGTLLEFLQNTGILSALFSRFERDFTLYKNYFVDCPFVDFIRIHECFQGNHYSIFLYKEMSKWLKERGMRFRLSDVASKQALAVREHMKSLNLLEESTIEWYDGTQSCYLMK